MNTLANIVPSSFGFSGAGFLTCYHLGVVECLLKHGKLRRPGDLPTDDNKAPILTGVSGGALVATAVSLGILPEDAMKATIKIAEATRKAGGVLDHLRPGFSLIDEVESAIQLLVEDIDEEYALRRIDNGRLLRIGLTDSRTFPRFRFNPNAYVYVDMYDSLEEILAACILSSYVPGLTGPVTPITVVRNGAVRRASEILENMTTKGFVKDISGLPIQDNKLDRSKPNDILFWDGGLANLFPTVDKGTCIVTPFTGRFANPSISPSPPVVVADAADVQRNYSRPTLCLENIRTVRYIAFSSESIALESWFEQGYNDAKKHLTHRTPECGGSSFKAVAHQSVAREFSDVNTPDPQ